MRFHFEFKFSSLRFMRKYVRYMHWKKRKKMFLHFCTVFVFYHLVLHLHLQAYYRMSRHIRTTIMHFIYVQQAFYTKKRLQKILTFSFLSLVWIHRSCLFHLSNDQCAIWDYHIMLKYESLLSSTMNYRLGYTKALKMANWRPIKIW